MRRSIRKGCFDLIRVVIADRAVHRPIGGTPVVADVFAIHHPVLVPDRFIRGIRTDLPGFAAFEVQSPDPVLHQVPGAFVTVGHQLCAPGRGVQVSEPIVLFKGHFRAAPIQRHLDDPRMGACLPDLAKADVPVPEIDLELIGEILKVPGADVSTVCGHVRSSADIAFRARVQRALVERCQVQRHQGISMIVDRLVAHGAHIQPTDAFLLGPKARQLRDLTAFQVDAEQVGTVFTVRDKKHLLLVGIPAGVREVKVAAMPLVGRPLPHPCTADRILKCLPFRSPAASFAATRHSALLSGSTRPTQ